MKQTVLILLSLVLGTAANAQRHAYRTHNINPQTAVKTTAVGDTLVLSNINSADTLTMYSYPEGGYVTGPNAFGDRGFAERYDINGSDSSITVIGVMSHFGGKVNPASTRTINFKVWGLTPLVPITSSLAYQDLPTNSQDTLTVPVTQLGIGTTTDTVKSFFFPRPTDTIQGGFYIGYDLTYSFSSLNGDTIGLYSTVDGNRNTPLYNIVAVPPLSEIGDTTYDTVIVVQNATLWSDNNWHDNYTQNDSIFNNLAIYPIVVIGQPTGINSITRKDLTFYGNYPNPANDITNIRFSLAKAADVTITVMDLQGRAVQTIPLQHLAASEHIVPVNVSSLAAGSYVYSVVTSGGDGIAGKLTIIR